MQWNSLEDEACLVARTVSVIGARWTLLHRHMTCGHDFDPVMVCSQCDQPIDPRQVHVHPGPGARGTNHRPASQAVATPVVTTARPRRKRATGS